MSGCDALQAACSSDERRELVRASGALCGIDDVEVYDDGVTLCVRLFGAVPEGLKAWNVVVTGGAEGLGLGIAPGRGPSREMGLGNSLAGRGVIRVHCSTSSASAAGRGPGRTASARRPRSCRAIGRSR